MAAVERQRRFPTSLVVLGLPRAVRLPLRRLGEGSDPGVRDPFGTATVDRSGPAVLKSIENLRDFRAASGHFEVIVDVERMRASFRQIKGERVLFVAVGSVDAGVDFRGLEEDAVDVSDDGKGVTLELPPATFAASSTSSAPTSTTATAARSTGSVAVRRRRRRRK